MVKVITILSIPSHVLWNQLLQAGLIHPLLSCCVLQSGPPVYFRKKYWTAAPITWPSGPCFTRWFWSRNDSWKGLGPENLWEPQSGCLVGRTAPQGRSPWSPITGSFFFYFHSRWGSNSSLRLALKTLARASNWLTLGKGEAGEEQMSVKTDLGHLEVGGGLCLGQPAQDPLLCPFPKWRNQWPEHPQHWV